MTFILCQPAIFFLKNGVVDELDFWGGTFFLVVFAAIEVILFSWVFGLEKAWDEIHVGADLRIPNFYKFIIKYITPLFIFAILAAWLIQEWIPVILMKGVAPENVPYILGTRLGLVTLLVILAFGVKLAWDRKKLKGRKN
ncbi:MAG: hypothetical protein COW13_01910 [Candidatus Omnitrophica bacterium CG12_big_fil_rev_8_21_14_0_65_50_5]|nr:MAG: hypothetical protein COW13_01910 [Candidatus Omnitrophica bacterium CG12_big_fil_rev_8_21_14_0_65_50_5]